jgi:hypothetical protein
LFDFGTTDFENTIEWLIKNYPAKFSRILAYQSEAELAKVFRKFTYHTLSSKIPKEYSHVVELKENPLAEVESNENSISIVQELKDTARKSDFVVVRIDLDGDEWEVLKELETNGVLSLVDELFVKLHFQADQEGWEKYEHTIDDAFDLLTRLRRQGVFVHYWP